MATARRSGTNEGIATYGTSAASRDFCDLSTWEVTLDVDITTGIEQVEVSNVTGDRFITGELLDFSSSGATATFYGISGDSATIWYKVLTGTPTTADTITSNGASSASADIDTITSTNTGMTAVLECYDDSASFNDSSGFSGGTTTSSFFRILRSASGQGHDGTTNNGFTLSGGTMPTFNLGEANFTMQDIIVRPTGVSSGDSLIVVELNGDNVSTVGLLLFDIVNGGAGNYRGFKMRVNNTFAVLCLVNDTDGHNIESKPAAGNTAYIYNCTLHAGAARGISNSNGTCVAKNVLSTGHTGGDDFDPGTYTGSGDCASQDTTASDESIGVDITDTDDMTTIYENISGDDFHLKSTATTQVRNAGADLSSDGNFAFDDDINDGTMGAAKSGELWFDWDIGFDEDTIAAVVAPMDDSGQLIVMP